MRWPPFSMSAGLLAGLATAWPALAQDESVEAIVSKLALRPALTRSLAASPSRHIEVVPGQQDQVLAATTNQPSVSVRVLFDYGSDNLTADGKAGLGPLGRALQDPRLQNSRLLISGHTDARGSDEFNQSLSERRARAVREFLVVAFQIRPERLESMGFGRRKLADAAHPDDPINRRVEVINLGQ